MENQDKKPNIIAIIGAIVLLVLAVVGLSYAFFSAFIKNGETDTSIEGTGANLSLVYTDGKSVITSSNIMPGWSATKTFTVTNNGEADTYYKLNISNITNEFVDGGLTFSISSTDGGTNIDETPVGTEDRTISQSILIAEGKTHTYTITAKYINLDTDQTPDLGKSFSYTIGIEASTIPAPNGWYEAGSGTLLASLRDSNILKTPLTTPGKEVSAHTLDDVPSQITPVSSLNWQAYYITYGTGWEANGNKFNLTGTAVTSDTYANSYSSLVGKYLVSDYIPDTGSSTAGTMKTTTNLNAVFYVVSAKQNGFTFKIVSSNKNTTEALLASTEDDYGTSYYFRGAVKNNYVKFANKCWRIVRVGGDGSVKLILHNDNTSGAANPCDAANNNAYAAFARYSGTTYQSKFNEKYDDNAYVGFKYGTPGSSTYEATHANTNNSTILTNLETWYNNNLKKYEKVIADTVWCNDKTNVTDTSYNPWNYSNITGLGYGYAKNKTYYGATQRLVSSSNSTGGTGPSLKCNGELSKIYSKVGLITLDELALAGYAYKLNNTTTYLHENATNTHWWSMSPARYGDTAVVWDVSPISAGFTTMYTVNNTSGVRPAISLVSSITISGGTGTSEDPYIVK